MKYNRTHDGLPIEQQAVELLALFGAEEPAVPILHAPNGKKAHLAGLGIVFGIHDDEGWDPRLVMEIAAAAEKPGAAEQPSIRHGAWNLTCGDCGHRLSKKESELVEKSLGAVVARRAGRTQQSHTVKLA